ncbi:MAG: isoprenylcysteine carboxylmethyltransferase family protein [Bacteroidota bacterium]
MEKLTFLGIGPKIGRIAIPYLAIAVTLGILYPGVFSFGHAVRLPFMVAGTVLIVVALIYYFSTLRLMLPGIKENRLVTGGAYRICRNPLYSALILFLFPGLALASNSWIILTASVVAYVVFRIVIHEEEEQLERIFGDEYREYMKRTPRFFPKIL